MEELVSKIIDYKTPSIYYKVQAHRQYYNFLYSDDNKCWETILSQVDAKFLSTEVAGGFVGVFYGMYTTSLGEKSSNKADFYYFEKINLEN